MKGNGWRSILLRAFEVWLIISVAETLHGATRISLLEPLIGDITARQIAVLSGSLIILTIAFLFRKWIGAATTRECLAVGMVWIGLTLAYELVLGRFVMGLSWQRIFSDYNIVRGGLMPLGLVTMLLAPLIVTGIRTRHRGLPQFNGTSAT